jgi:hypothetical protein
MAKAFDDEINERLRALARRVMAERGDGKNVRLAEMLDVSPAFVSELLSGKRGAGLETLIGLGRFAPLELLSILGIEPGVIVTLLEGTHDGLEAGLAKLPDVIRRAARAAIELEGCSPGAAGDAAVWCWNEYGAVPDSDADWWLGKIRKRLSLTAQSGERPSEKLRNLQTSQG